MRLLYFYENVTIGCGLLCINECMYFFRISDPASLDAFDMSDLRNNHAVFLFTGAHLPLLHVIQERKDLACLLLHDLLAVVANAAELVRMPPQSLLVGVPAGKDDLEITRASGQRSLAPRCLAIRILASEGWWVREFLKSSRVRQSAINSGEVVSDCLGSRAWLEGLGSRSWGVGSPFVLLLFPLALLLAPLLLLLLFLLLLSLLLFPTSALWLLPATTALVPVLVIPVFLLPFLLLSPLPITSPLLHFLPGVLSSLFLGSRLSGLLPGFVSSWCLRTRLSCPLPGPPAVGPVLSRRSFLFAAPSLLPSLPITGPLLHSLPGFLSSCILSRRLFFLLPGPTTLGPVLVRSFSRLSWLLPGPTALGPVLSRESFLFAAPSLLPSLPITSPLLHSLPGFVGSLLISLPFLLG